MNNHHQRFLAVLRAALQDTAIQLNDLRDPEWTALLQLAQAHRVLPLFCQALNPAPAQILSLRGVVRQLVALQAMRTEVFTAVYQKLLDAGLRPLVVKGLACRVLYPQHDLRPSSDEDLLIPPEQFETARSILTSMGFEESGTGFELAFRHPSNGFCLELHGQPFPDREEAYSHWNRQFADLFQRPIPLTVAENTFWTPDHGDHLLYLILHALKHFLHSGVGIRQVCDICLYARAWASQINWEQLWQRCRSLHAEKFAAALFRIGSEHLSISACPIPVPTDELPLLEDILQAGLYGDASPDRRRSSNLTLDAASGRNPSILSSLFPGRSRLLNRYPWLRGYPLLLPAAWVCRLWGYARSAGRSELHPTESARIGKERLALLRRYGLLR